MVSDGLLEPNSFQLMVFNGLYIDYYSFTDSEGMEGREDQGKFAS